MSDADATKCRSGHGRDVVERYVSCQPQVWSFDVTAHVEVGLEVAPFSTPSHSKHI